MRKFRYFVTDEDGTVIPLEDATLIRISEDGWSLLEEHDPLSEELDHYRQDDEGVLFAALKWGLLNVVEDDGEPSEKSYRT